jgi:prophage DNA circulation protein
MPAIKPIPHSAWQAALRPASFKGVGFGVRGDSIESGHRIADHQYPFRNVPFREDLGRLGRAYNFEGFVIGDDAVMQAKALLAVCEAGQGTLIHPTFGTVTAICFRVRPEDRVDAGHYVAFTFTFLEAGQVNYPNTPADTQANVRSLANQTGVTIAIQYASNIARVPVPIAT